MKYLLTMFLVLAGFVGINAQSPQTANEFNLGYSYLRQDIDVTQVPVLRALDTDNHGFSAGYTRYLGGDAKKAGVVGLTFDLGVNGGGNEASLVTVMGGLKAQARNNSRFQPFARAMVGAARQNVNRVNIRDNSEASVVFDAGLGLAINLAKNSRYKLFGAADYVNTGFNGERQNGARIGIGLQF